MKRLLKGFTLAEVLITLGIIGVIASLTLPNLSININKQQIGPALAKAINILESANALALSDTGARTLDQLDPVNKDVSVYLATIKKYIEGGGVGLFKKYLSFDMKSVAYLNPMFVHNSKDGITYLNFDKQPTPLDARSDLSNLPLSYSGKYYALYVDVNGNEKGPNSIGRDTYRLYVDTKGTVIAYGSNEFSMYTNDLSWKSYCNHIEVTKEVYCAGAVVDNGFKVVHY